MMVAVFVIGAGVGLAGAWWIHKPQPSTPVAVAVPSTAVRSLPATPAADGKRPGAIRGISPSELPYDGAPPPAIPSDPEPVAARAPVVPEMSSGASNEPAGERSAGAGEIEKEAPPAAPVIPPAAAQKSPPAQKADDKPKAAKGSTREDNASMASGVPKRKSATRSDREIERIRRQVDEELKKKTDHGRAPSDNRPGAAQGARNDQVSRQGGSSSASVARVSATRASLARCDRKSNFIRREMCRWDVCKGGWGKNGCPSYQQQASTY